MKASPIRLAAFGILGLAVACAVWALLTPASDAPPSSSREAAASASAKARPQTPAKNLAPEEARYRAGVPLQAAGRRAQAATDSLVNRGAIRNASQADAGTILVAAGRARDTKGISTGVYAGNKLVSCRTALEMREPTIVCLGRDLVAEREFTQYTTRRGLEPPVRWQRRATARAVARLGSPKAVIAAPR